MKERPQNKKKRKRKGQSASSMEGDGRIRILHLEDNPNDALLIKEMIASHEDTLPVSIHQVHTKEAFLAELQKDHIDLILCDYRIPGYDGIEALETAKKAHPDVPVIMVTGEMGEERAVETLKLGAADYVLKDRMKRLIPSIQRALKEAASERERCSEGQALAASEKKYRDLFESMTEGFLLVEMVTDGTGKAVSYRYLEANPALEKMTHLKRKDIIGKTVHEVLPIVESHWVEAFGRVASSGRSERIEEYSEGLGGWYDVYIYSPERGKAALIYTNVTERKRTEQTLRESEEKYRAIVTGSRDVIYRFNLQTSRFEYISESAKEVVGYSAEELMALDSETSRMMIHPDDRPAFQAALARLEETGTAEAEYRQLTKTGEYRWLSNRMSHMKDAVGQWHYRIGNIRDITEHKRDEKALDTAGQQLEQANRLLSGIINSTADLVAAVDTDFRYIAFNEAYRKECLDIFEGREICIGLSIIEYLAPLPADQKSAVQLFEPALRGETTFATAEFGRRESRRRCGQPFLCLTHFR